MESSERIAEAIKRAAFNAGFSHCGITAAEAMPEAEARFRRWLEGGNQAGMKYLERDPERRFNPGLLVPGARSVIVLAIPYGDAETALANTSGIGMYAWGEDYHRRLPSLGAPIMEILRKADPESASKFFTDSGFLAERSLAVKAGLGWIGKNGTLITPSRGSMVLLASIITTIALPADQPYTGSQCGDCTLCMDACPTVAIETPGLVNAIACIAYHTNTSRATTIPEEVRSRMNGQIYGCDICQSACPWNSRSRMEVNAHYALPENWPLHPEGWDGRDEAWFTDVFRGSVLEDAGFARMRRNVDAVLQRASSGASPQANEGN